MYVCMYITTETARQVGSSLRRIQTGAAQLAERISSILGVVCACVRACVRVRACVFVCSNTERGRGRMKYGERQREGARRGWDGAMVG